MVKGTRLVSGRAGMSPSLSHDRMHVLFLTSYFTFLGNQSLLEVGAFYHDIKSENELQVTLNIMMS